MAKTASAGSTKKDGATMEEVLAHNSELAEQVATLTAKVGDLSRAAAMGVGIDSALQEMTAKRERKLVQFKENFARAPIPSPIQPKRKIQEGYQARAGEICALPVEEIARLEGAIVVRHEPDRNGKTKVVHKKIVETDPKNFVSQKVHRVEARTDSRGRLYYERVVDEIDVATLKKNAQPKG